MLESVIQSQIIKYLESEGWYVIKLIQTNKNGIPDLAAFKNSKAVFIEVKRPGNKPTDLQLYRHRQLTEKGFLVIVADTLTQVKKLTSQCY